jgi:hypothetical protein
MSQREEELWKTWAAILLAASVLSALALVLR